MKEESRILCLKAGETPINFDTLNILLAKHLSIDGDTFHIPSFLHSIKELTYNATLVAVINKGHILNIMST